MPPDTHTKGQPSIGEAALFALCPKCGARGLFKGWVNFADQCDGCGLDLARFNVGDGPAAFLTLIIGGVITGLAAWLQLSAEPPWWVHMLLWVPLTTLGVIFGLRFSKAALLASEYRQNAGEAVAQDIAPADKSKDSEI